MKPGAEPGCVYVVRSPAAPGLDGTGRALPVGLTVAPDRGGIRDIAPFVN